MLFVCALYLSAFPLYDSLVMNVHVLMIYTNCTYCMYVGSVFGGVS